jgi:hypothetical protein
MRKVVSSVLSGDESIASPPIIPANREVLRASASIHNCKHPVSLLFRALLSGASSAWS